MKIALVHSYYSSRQPSGENVVVDAQAKALRDYGFDVRVIATRTDELEGKRGYKLSTAVNVATGKGASPLRELNDFAPDIVHVHNLFPNWGTYWLNQWHGPLVATLHNFRPVCAAGTLFRDGAECTLCPDTTTLAAVKHACYRGSKVATIPLAVRSRNGVSGDPLLNRADAIVVLTERARRMYTEFGLPQHKTSVIPNFVHDSSFSPLIVPGNDWVYIGRLSQEKGILNLIKHWPESQTLRIYGDGPLRNPVENATESVPNVSYLGRLDHDAVPTVLAEARGLLLPSEWAEGLPLSYIEALAAGRMVVAMAGSSGADDLAEAGAGTIFADWAGLQDALNKARAQAELFATRARCHYEHNYRREAFLERTNELYQNLLAASHRVTGRKHA